MEKEIRYKKKKKLGSYPYLSVVFGITMALFVIGVFGILILHANRLTQLIRENLEIYVYLSKDITDSEKIKFDKTLSSKPYLLVVDNEPQLTFIPKEEAAKKFIEETGEDFLKFLGENPLRDVYILKIKPDLYTKAQLERIKKDIQKISGVYEVTYQENLINSINENMAKISLVLMGLSCLLIIIVIVLINNTIKLALFSQRLLIRSMQLVGATSGFIRRPFLLRSIFHGFISGVIAAALLFILLEYSYQQIEGLSTLQEENKLFILMGIIIFTGMFLAFSSTFYSIRKYLKLSLDELY